MTKKLTTFISILLCIYTTLSFGQTNKDSLWNVWTDNQETDSVRVGALIQYYSPYMYTKPDSAMLFARMHLNFGKQIGSARFMGDGMNSIGQIHWLQGNPDSAVYWYNESILQFRKAGRKKGEAGSTINIGIIYANKGEIEKAIDYYEKGIALCEEIGEVEYKLNALNNMGVIYLDRGNYDEAINVFREVSELAAKELPGSDAHKGGLVNMGFALAKKGNHREAIECYHQCIKLIDQGGTGQVIIYAYNFLGNSYLEMGENENALKYFQLSFDIANKAGDKFGMAQPLSNMGDIYLSQGEPQKARDAFQKSLELMMESGFISAALQPLYNLANLDLDEGNLDSADALFNRGLQKSRTMGELDQEAGFLMGLGRLNNVKKRYSIALNHLLEGYKIADEIGDLKRLIQINEQLSISYEGLGQSDLAFDTYREFIHYRDSLERDENKRAAIREEYRYSYEKQAIADSLEQRVKDRLVEAEHQEEIRKKEKTRNAFIVIGVFVILLAIGLYSRLQFVRKSKAIIEKEKERSDNLLLNILPAEVAEELKEKGESEARDFDEVTVLFTDFVQFTETAEKLNAKQLVSEINACFKTFDEIIQKYNIEKIKTIGDAYMAAGGLTNPKVSSTADLVAAALEMQDFMIKRKKENESKGEQAFEMRVGIHTGPVVAGIVGVKKFQYDIWGDTVNTAARMESNGEAGKVNISNDTYELIKSEGEFEFESRGKIEVKGKGRMEMWFVALKK